MVSQSLYFHTCFLELYSPCSIFFGSDGKLVVGKCDVEENDDIAMEFGVRNIPTILFFKGGQLVDKFVGAASKATLTEKFQALL